MKTHIIKFSAFLLLWVGSFFAFSCEEPDKTGGETVKLQGTKWKLAGIVEVQTGKMKILEPTACEECYTLTLETDSTLSSYSSANSSNGIYRANSETGNMNIVDLVGTELAERGDGVLYVNALLAVQSFSCKGTELQLYYDNKKSCLQFKPQKP